MKAALFLAEGFETVEALGTVDILRRAGIETDTVSVTDSVQVLSSQKINVSADTVISKIQFDSYDILILPGGMPGTINLEKCKVLTEAVIRFNSQGKLLAAICAAPTVLAHTGCLTGKKASVYPGREKDLEDGGAKVSFDSVSEDGNVITARGMGVTNDFALAIVARCAGRGISDNIRKGIIAG